MAFLFFSSIFLLLCSPAFSLSTFAISRTANLTFVCAFTPFLNCSGGIRLPGVGNSSVSYAGLVAGDGFICALRAFSSSSTSAVVCWRFSDSGTVTDYKRIYQGPLIKQLDSSDSQICGISEPANRLLCWQWRRFYSDLAPLNLSFSSIAVGEGFVCGISEYGSLSCHGNSNSSVVSGGPSGNFSSIAAGFNHACALDRESELHCWGAMEGENPQGKFKSMALGENRSCGLRLNETVVCWGQSGYGLPESLRDTLFLSIEAKRDVFCGVEKLNFSLICWGFQHPDPILAFGEAMPAPCRSVCPCGVLPGSGKFCSQGNVCSDCSTVVPALPPPAQQSPPPSPDDDSGGGRWSGRMITYLVVGIVGSVLFFVGFGFFLFRVCKCRGFRVHDSGRLDEIGASATQRQTAAPVLEKRLSQLASMGNAGNLEEFSLQDLIRATHNFAEDHKLGKGSFGSVYLGILEDGSQVAIKRAETSTTSSYMVVSPRQEDKDNAFINELESLSRLHHKNLVRLIGFCEDRDERILVYEYMSNGTLHDHLHKLQNSPMMSWGARIKVALDAARGIEYLHEYSVPSIIHRDIKSSNILLDNSWTAKVSDFGLSHMGPQDEESHLSILAAGTVGYMDPEYYRLQQLTKKSDVYSFGVLMLEMLSGRKAIHKNENGVPRNVVDYVVPYVVQDEIHRVLDSRVPPPTPFEIEAVAYVGYLAVDCVTLEGRDRPSMTEVVNSLERALAACLVDPTSLSRSTTASSD